MNSDSYVLLPQANEDLVESAQYLIENASEDVAGRFLVSVFSTARLLAEMPAIGMNCHFTKLEFQNVRRFWPKGFERWLVFYRPVPNGIEVVRVLHSSRDWLRIFA